MSVNQELNGQVEETDGFNTEALALAIAEAADERKAEAIRILDVRGMVSYADFIVVCHGNSTPHVRAIANYIVEDLRPLKVRPRALEGTNHADWILVDFMDVVVHVFHEDVRAEYAIESIFHDAPRLPFAGEHEAEAALNTTTEDNA